MSDLIRRQDAIDAINHICPIDTEYDCALLDRVDVRYVLSDLPSAEPERKVIDTHGKIYKFGSCGACGAPVIEGDKYCSECGAKLDWSE